MAGGYPEYLCPRISHVDIAWACVATSDANPLHLDREFAVRQRGYQDVLVPGTMLVGWIGEYLAEWAGSPERVLRWQVRFTAPVWPNEQVTLRGRELARIEDEEGTLVSCEVIAATAEEKIAAHGSAQIRIPCSSI